jgi:glycosyltransferase involved in cell wall biosynthesis
LLGAADARRIESTHDRLAFLFIGRMLYYKGLPLFVEACEVLRQEGLSFGIGVVGHGDIEAVRERLVSCGAEIANRWIPHGEVAPLLARYDAVVIPSIAASQSGGVALAHGHGLPAIVTPVGGLVEQVKDGTTGLVAASVSAADVAAQMRRFLTDPDLRRRLADGVHAEQEARSMRRFVDEIERLAAKGQATSSS